jgi:UDP-N-acetylglucosamine 2-epimerase (non-hydrolysing)
LVILTSFAFCSSASCAPCADVLTDSGGIQKETAALQAPRFDDAANTERPMTVSCGTNLLVGQDPTNIVRAAREVLAGHGKRGCVPELWDGCAAERIVKIILREQLL